MKTKAKKCADAFTVHENSKDHHNTANTNDSEKEILNKRKYSDSREGITEKRIRARNPYETVLLSKNCINYIKEILEQNEE